DLVLVEVKLVGEEAERPADAECAGAELAKVPRRGLALAPALVVAVAAPSPAAAAGMAAPVVVPTVVGAPPVHHPWIHDLSSRGGGYAPGGAFGVGTMPHARRRLVLPGRESTGGGSRLTTHDWKGGDFSPLRRSGHGLRQVRRTVGLDGAPPCSPATLH